jgi:hypothetical protein
LSGTESTPEYQAIAELDAEARAALPLLLARCRALENQQDEINAALRQVKQEIYDQMGNVIVEHTSRGQIGITRMAKGSMIYWLPDIPDR